MKRIRKIIKEDPVWLSVLLVTASIAVTALNLVLIGLNLKGIL